MLRIRRFEISCLPVIQSKYIFYTRIVLVDFLVVFFLLIGFGISLVDQMTVFTRSVNSDWLYIFEVAKNLHERGNLFGQDVPTAPYFFPDLALFWALGFITINPALETALYYIGFSIALTGVVFCLYIFCGVSRRLALFSACLTVLTFAVLPPFDEKATYFPTFLKNYPASHSPAAVLSLGALTLYLRLRDAPINWLTFSLIFFGALFAYISDVILFSYLICPLIVLCIIDIWNGRLAFRSAVILFAATLVPFAIDIGSWSFQYKLFDLTSIITFSFQPILSVAVLEGNLNNFWVALRMAAANSPVFYSQMFIFEILCLSGIAFSFLKSNEVGLEGKQKENFHRIALFLFIAQVAILASGILLNSVSHPDLFRYLVPLYLFPIVFGYLTLVRLSSTSQTMRLWGLAAMIGFPAVNILLLVYNSGERLRTVSLDPPYPAWIRCVDEAAGRYGLKAGLTTYWDARPVRMLSRSNIQIGQIDEAFNFSFLADNRSSIFGPDGKAHDFQFIISESRSDGISVPTVIQKIGEPQAVVACPPSRQIRDTSGQPGPVLLIYASEAARPALNAYIALKASALLAQEQHLYSIGSIVDFSKNGDPKNYMTQGWSAVEVGGTWSVGKASGLIMALKDVNTSDDLLLTVQAAGFIPSTRPTQQISVSVNGKTVNKWTFGPGNPAGERSALIPFSLRRGKNRLEIVFHNEDPRSPKELLGLPDSDIRKLGIFVSWMRLDAKVAPH